MKNKRIGRLREFYELYTSGLTRDEVEHLLKKDTVEAFAYLRKKTDIPEGLPGKKPVRTFIHVTKEIFISFVMKLTPARRLFYGIGIAAFLVGLMEQGLIYMLGSFFVMNLLLALELVDKLTTRDELEIAREIQIGLQPLHIPESRLLSFATFSQPARVVGGDFFDIVHPDPDRIVSILGDVSGKGVSAALYAAYTQSMFQSFSETRMTPLEIFSNLNKLISRRLRDGEFITAVIALFDLEERSVTIARAGHNWPLYYSSRDRMISELKTPGLSIGLTDPPLFTARMQEQKIHLHPGDFLLLYSDGITEAANPRQEMFDVSGLKSVIRANAHEPSASIVSRIQMQLFQFLAYNELQDDATMVGIKVK